MVRLGLGDMSESESESGEDHERPRSGRFSAPMHEDEDDDEEVVVVTPRNQRRSTTGSSSSSSSGGLAQQLGLSGEAVSATRQVLLSSAAKSRRASGSAGKQRSSRDNQLVLMEPVESPQKRKKPRPTTRYRAHRQVSGVAVVPKVPLAASRCAQMEAAALKKYQTASKRVTMTASHRARSFGVSISSDGRLARPAAGRGHGVEILTVKLSVRSPVPELQIALAHCLRGGDQIQQQEDDEEAEGVVPPAFGFPRLQKRGSSSSSTALASCVAAYLEGARDGPTRQMWGLVEALWSESSSALPNAQGRPSLIEMSKDKSWAASSIMVLTSSGPRVGEALARRRRSEAVKRWLASSVLLPDVEEAYSKNAAPLEMMYKEVFELLTRRQTQTAAERCARDGETRLALLIASATSAAARPALLAEFAAKRSSVASAKDALYARILGVLAGCLELEDEIEAEHHYDDNEHMIADWRKRLGLHTWYEHPDSLALALTSYDAAVSKGTAARPASEGSGASSSVCYRLLQLRCALEGYSARGDTAALAVMDEAALGLGTGDVGDCWHLQGVLEAYYSGCSLSTRSRHSQVAEALIFECCSSSEDRDWAWAVFVACATYSDRTVRRRVVQEILQRHAWSDVAIADKKQLTAAQKSALDLYESRRRFCLEKLGVPQSMLDDALATRAGVAGPPKAHADFLLAAGRWSEAQEALLRHQILPRALFSAGPDFYVEAALGLLAPLKPRLEKKQKNNWRSKGGLHHDFARFLVDRADLENCSSLELVAKLAADARDLRLRLEAPCSLSLLQPTANAAQIPALEAACRQDMATQLATAELNLGAVLAGDETTSVALLNELADPRTILAPKARSDRLKGLALQICNAAAAAA